MRPVGGQDTRGTQATSRWFLLSRLASRRVAVHETWRTTGGWGSPSSRGESCENSPQLYRGEKTPKPHRVNESFFVRYGGINCGNGVSTAGPSVSAPEGSGCRSCSKGNTNYCEGEPIPRP